MRSGGYSIYFRHAATDWGQNDRIEAPGDWASCESDQMRQLSETVIRGAQGVLSEPPPSGTNVIIVGHGNLMQAATRAYTSLMKS
jgi:broad specificity phosphatase PhoE